MSRTRRYIPLIVGMNGIEVGIFTRGVGGEFSFEYHPDWISNERSFSISRSIALIEGKQRGEHIRAYFDNLLPDSQAVLNHIATRFGATGTDAYSLLKEIGSDCVGALQFVQDAVELEVPNTPLRYEILSEKDIERDLKNLKPAPLGIHPEGEFRIEISD